MSLRDRIKGPLAQFVALVLYRVDYLALYPAKVNAQNADLTLELTPDDPRLPRSFSKIPIRLGLPNATVKVSAGARVLLGFAGGKPSAPVATLWETATCTELVLNGTVIKLNNGGTPVAKEGSGTTGHTHVLTGQAGPFTVAGTAQLATDSIASGAGSSSIKVP